MPTETQVLWLNITNAVLGLVVAASFLALGWAIVADLLARRKESVTHTRGLEGALRLDPHSVFLPGLGFTMADGGEPVNEPNHSSSKGKISQR